MTKNKINNVATFQVNCLIRDKMVEFFGNDGITRVTKILSEEEAKIEILNKLVEESEEVKSSNSKENLIEELCDVLTVYRRILNLYKINQEEIEEKIKQKETERGGFNKNIFLSNLLVPQDNKWYSVFLNKYKLIHHS